MNRTQKLIDTIARLNPDAGEIGAGMLANIVAEARAIQAMAPRYPVTFSEPTEPYPAQAAAVPEACGASRGANCELPKGHYGFCQQAAAVPKECEHGRSTEAPDKPCWICFG